MKAGEIVGASQSYLPLKKEGDFLFSQTGFPRSDRIKFKSQLTNI
jgi:hypothetical protein